MNYKDFTIITFTSNNIQKCNKRYNGFNCSIYSKYDKKCNTPLDCFDIAVGYDTEGKDYNKIILSVYSYIDSNYDELIELENSYFCNDTFS